jgi:hypothetical protein
MSPVCLWLPLLRGRAFRSAAEVVLSQRGMMAAIGSPPATGE